MRSKLSQEQKEQFKIDSETMTLKELAEKYHMEQCTVSKWRYTMGIGKHYPVMMPSVERFAQDITQYTNVQLAEKYGVGLRLISKWRVKMGLANVWPKQLVNWEKFDKDAMEMRGKDVCVKYAVSKSVMALWKQKRGLTTGKKENRVITWVELKSGCWLCTSHASDEFGYPVCKQYGSVAKRKWSEINGEWPEGMNMLHSCDNPTCINPDHIRPGTMKENQQEMAERDRSPWGDRCGARVLSSEEAKQIYDLKGKGMSQRAVGKSFGVSGSTIGNIWNDKTWVRDVAGKENFHELLTVTNKIKVRKGRKLSPMQVNAILSMKNSGKTGRVVAKEFRISNAMVSKIWKGKAWVEKI